MSAAGRKPGERWSRRLRHLAEQAAAFVLPPVCVSCRRQGAVFCEQCEQSLSWFSENACPTCGRDLPAPGLGCAWCRGKATPLTEIRAVCAFEGAAREAIHALKYEGMFGVARPLALLMVKRFPAWKRAPELVIPIPLHHERVRERGYNQSVLLARHLCRQPVLQGDAVMDEDALWRIRHTRPQVGLDRLQRRQNVAGAFAADAARVRGRRVLLIDDVCTSGATLAAAAEALLEQGAAAVSGFCFARPRVGVDVV